MMPGLLADIHEHTRRLQKAIAVLHQHGAERFVVLGDVLDTGKRIEPTVRLLQEVRAVGVWGNHDVGLCFDPGDSVCERHSHRRRRHAPCRTPGCNLSPALGLDVDPVGPRLPAWPLRASPGRGYLTRARSTSQTVPCLSIAHMTRTR
jgi:hypothetical protein